MFAIVEALHATPPRAYHNLAHISECLTLLDETRGLAVHADEVEIAIWFHDCIYVPGAADNETRSADIASMCSRELGLHVDASNRITNLILATLHKPKPLVGDAALVADLDMSILAASRDRYDQYATQIRQEFGFVNDSAFSQGRSKFLAGLLTRTKIYHVPDFAHRFESKARSNISREIELLKDAASPA